MIDDSEIILELEECESCIQFFQIANKILKKRMRTNLPGVFIQDEDVMKYAVEPLLNEGGPLDGMDVMVKLTYALGKISLNIYADINAYMQFLDYLEKGNQSTDFKDEIVYDFISNISILKDKGAELYMKAINGMKFSSFESYSEVRYINLVRTVLTLSVTLIISQIESDA